MWSVLLESSRLWFFLYWAFFLGAFWFGNGHSPSEFLVLIPYGILSVLLAAMVVLRLYVFGHFKDDELK